MPSNGDLLPRSYGTKGNQGYQKAYHSCLLCHKSGVSITRVLGEFTAPLQSDLLGRWSYTHSHFLHIGSDMLKVSHCFIATPNFNTVSFFNILVYLIM